jgi:hypothetical protein
MVNSNDEFFNSVVGINNEVEAAPTDGVEQENQSGAKDILAGVTTFTSPAGVMNYIGKNWDALSGSWQRGRGIASTYDERDDVFDIESEQAALQAPDSLYKAYIEASKKNEQIGQGENVEAWMGSLSKNLKDGENWFMSTLMATQEHGMIALAEVSLQSIAQGTNKRVVGEAMPVTTAGLGVGLAAGGFGALATGPASFMAGTNYAVETVATFDELLKEELKSKNLEFTPDNIRIVMADDESRSRIKRKARQRGATIGLIEGVTQFAGIKGSSAIAKTINKTKKLAALPKKVASATATGTVAATSEVVGGGAGEFLGAKAAGMDATAEDIIVESVAGLATTPATATLAAADIALTSPKYTLDGTKISKSALMDYVNGASPQELASMKIEIKNDDATAVEIRDKAIDSIIESQMPTNITNADERAELVKLEKQFRALKGKDTVTAEVERSKIKRQIKDIVSKYDGTEADAALEKTKKEVQDARLQKNVKFAEEGAKEIGRESKVFDTTEEALIYAMEQGMSEDQTNEFAGADGFFLGNTLVINKEVARETGAISVGSHELFHGIVGNSFDNIDVKIDGKLVTRKRTVKEKAKLIKSFSKVMTKSQRSVVEERILDNYNTTYDEKGKVINDNVYGLDKTKSIFDDSNIEKWMDKGDETLTAFSDGIELGQIQFDEGVFSKLMNLIQEVLRKAGINKEFQNGRQVYNFLKDYNKSVTKDKLSERQKEFAKKDFNMTEIDAKASYTKTERDNRLDAIGEKSTKAGWDAGGSDRAISDMYMSGDLEAIVRNNLSSDLKNLPNYSEEDFISETIGELMPHIKNFNPLRKEDKNGKKNPVYEYLIKAGVKESDISSLSLGQAKKRLSDYASKETTSEADKININKTIEKYGLSGWIRGQVSNKIGEVLKKKKATTETFTVDTTDEKVKETVESADDLQDLQEEDLSVAAQAKKKAEVERREEKGMEEDVEYSTFRRALKVKGKQGLSDNIVDNVKQAVVKTMATERTTPDSDKFIANIKKSFLTELKKPIQDMMGKKDDFTNFLKTNREAIIAALPTSTLVQMERNVDPADRVFTVEVKRNLNPTETKDAIANNLLPKDTNINSGPTLYNKRMPSEGEFLRYFSPPLYVPSKKDPNKSVRSGLKGTRKDTLAEQMGIELAFDATMEVVQSPDVAERRALVTSTEFGKAELAKLAKTIDRGVDVKFSRSNPAEVGIKMDLALDNVNTDAYLDIRFSKSSRDAYIKRLVKNRPDLKGKEEQYVDSVFDWLETTDIKKRSKYEKMAMHYMAKGYLILPEDGYKVIEAERLAAIKKIDPFSVGNPNDIIEKYAGTVKGARTNPDTVKEFSNKKDLGNGVVTYDVEQTKEGQLAVREVIDTHFGKKSNPWCLAARSERAAQAYAEFNNKEQANIKARELESQGYDVEVALTDGTYEVYGDLMIEPNSPRVLDEAFIPWKNYQEGGKGYQIVFTNGKLSHFRDGSGTYWDKMDKPSKYIPKKLNDLKLEDGFIQERELNVNTGEEVLGKKTKTTGNQQDGTYTNITIENDEVGDGKVEQVTGFNEVYDRVDDLEESGYEVSDPEVVQEGDNNTTVYEIEYFDPRATLKTDYKAVELKEVRENGKLVFRKKLTKYPGESYGTETKYSGDSRTITDTQSGPESLKKGGSPRWELETTLERAGKVAGVNLKLDKYTETTFVDDYKKASDDYYNRVGSKHTVKGELNGKKATVEMFDYVDVNQDSKITKVKVNGKTVYTAPKVDDTGIKFSQNRGTVITAKQKAERLTGDMVTQMDNLLDAYAKSIADGRPDDVIVIKRDKQGKPVSFTTKKPIKHGFDNRNYGSNQIAFMARFVYDIYNSNKYSRLYDKKTRDKMAKFAIALQKKGKKGYDLKPNRVHEMLFIRLMGDSFADINSNATVNRFIEEGGKGDVYVTLGESSIGLEIKMDEADGVSQTAYPTIDKNGNFTLEFSNPNKSVNGKKSEDALSEAFNESMQELQEILKAQGLGITNRNIEKNKNGKNRLVLDEAQTVLLRSLGYKTFAASSVAIDGNYIETAYAGKNQGFIQSGNKLFFMETGDSKLDKSTNAIVENAEKLGLTIPRFQNEAGPNNQPSSFIATIGITKFDERKDGKFDITIRTAPKILSKNLDNSDVNLLKRSDMDTLSKAINEELVRTNNIKLSKTRSKAMELGQLTNKDTEAVGMSTFDFDETLIIDGDNFITATKGDDVVKITSSQWPLVGDTYAAEGYTFDFSDFVNVRGGVDGPLLQKMKNQISKYGVKNVFVLTARPAESATAIQGWLESKGINIPLNNITGLGNSSGAAKAQWMLDKFAEGYNDMYFVDDALPNVDAVKNILDQLDAKSNVQLAKVMFSKSKYNSSQDPYSFVDFKTVPKEIVNSKSYKNWIKSLEGIKLFHGTVINPSDISKRGTNHSLNWFVVGGNNNEQAISLAKNIERDFDGEPENSVLSIDASKLAGRILPDADFIGPSDAMGISSEFAGKIQALEDKYKASTRVQSMIQIPAMYAEFLDIITEYNPMSGFSQTLFDKNGKLSVNTAVVVIGGLKPNQLKVESISDPKTAPKFSKNSLRKNKAVQNVLDQLDIKSNVQQAKIKFSKTASKKLNDMIERKKGIDSDEIISSAAARRRGENVNKFQIFVPPTAEDFSGLLYYFAGKGKQGDADLAFMKEFLLDPLSRGERDIAIKKQSLIRGYNELKDKNWKAAAKIKEMAADTPYTKGTAVRVYLWNQDKTDIPGLSDKEVQELVDIVKNDPELIAYADGLRALVGDSEGKYITPSNDWVVETIAKDLQDATSRVGRKKFLAEFIENADAFFSKDNLNKMEAAYGKDFRESLEDMLYRIKTGQNRPSGTDASTKKWMNWLNNSVGAIMFFNSKSAVLQLMSTVNYLNWSDNNFLLAGKAFANQKQFWSDFSMLWNSDFLKQRRFGLSTDINEAEIANAAAGAKNKATAVLAYLLKKGFLPTQIADSFAISSGGAAFYRNRVNSYIKQGMDQKAAEEKAMTDFREITEENQQSSRPDRISKQQASPLGRVILAFQNTPMQYARIIKKSVADIVAGRGDLKTHVSKIIFYGGVQSLIFGAMQNALFALAFDDEEDDKKLTKTELEKKQEKRDTQYERTLNTMLDSLLNGSGLTGRVLSTVKNVIFKFLQEKDKGWNSDMGNVAIEAANISPPLGSKLRKMKKAGDVYDWNQKVIDEMDTFDINNPIWEAGANVIESTTNVPAARAIKKLESIREAFNQNNETWQRIAVAMGWSQWDLGIEGKKRQAVQATKEYLKQKKKDEKAKNKKPKSKPKSKTKGVDSYFNKVVNSRKNEASKVQGGKYRCTALTQDLSQCKNRTDNSSRKCFLHN